MSATLSGHNGLAVFRIFSAQLISVTGDKLFTIALSWWIVDHAEIADREFVLGLVLGGCTLASAVSGPLLGPVIDRNSRRTCMMVADGMRLIGMCALAYLLHEDQLSLPLLFLLSILVYFFEPLFESAVSASLSPLSVSQEMLSQWIAVESAIPNVGAVLGAASGSLALATPSTEFAFWINAGTFLVSFLIVASLPPLPPPKHNTEHNTAKGGYGFIHQFPCAKRLILCFSLANFFVAPLFFYLPILARDVLRTDGSGLAALELAFAAGNLVVLIWLFARPTRFMRVRWLRCFLVALSGLFLLILKEATETTYMLPALAIWGGSIAFVTYLAITSFQMTIPDEYKGRFFALFNSVCTLSLPLSFACVGALSTRFSLQELMYGNAACLSLIALAFLSVPDELQGKVQRLYDESTD
jgi:MFS family permease